VAPSPDRGLGARSASSPQGTAETLHRSEHALNPATSSGANAPPPGGRRQRGVPSSATAGGKAHRPNGRCYRPRPDKPASVGDGSVPRRVAGWLSSPIPLGAADFGWYRRPTSRSRSRREIGKPRGGHAPGSPWATYPTTSTTRKIKPTVGAVIRLQIMLGAIATVCKMPVRKRECIDIADDRRNTSPSSPVWHYRH
jgi:hypothetical protein